MPAAPEPAAEPPSAPLSAPAHFQVHAWSLPLRWVALGAQLVHAANLAYLATLLLGGLLTGELQAPPLFVAVRLGLFSLLPLALVRLLRWLGRATLHVEPQQLVLQLRRVRFEIPASSVDALRPWRLPLPVPGFALRMKSGRTFRYGLEMGDPLPLLEALGAQAAGHPGTRYAWAWGLTRRRWWLLALKYGLFPLLPTVILFRAHQYIAYGGPFGQWQMLGLASYLQTFVLEYWAGVLSYMGLYAGLWRLLAGALAFSGTWAAPSWARGVRRSAEWLCALAYYVGLPVLLLMRFFL